jgi:hypothetical protein
VNRRRQVAVALLFALTTTAISTPCAHAYYEQPTTLDVTLDSSSFVISFSWPATATQPAGSPVGFGADQAMEFEIHVDSRCLVMPPLDGGRDETVDPAVVGVAHNLPGSSNDV